MAAGVCPAVFLLAFNRLGQGTEVQQQLLTGD
jgi:hypothetical protein